MDDGLHCHVDGPDGVPTVRVVGLLSVTSSLAVFRTLRKHLLDRGRVLVDISAMRVTWLPATALFPAVLAAAGGWPSARMVLYGGADDAAGRLRSTRSALGVPVAADRERALALLDVRPPRVRRTASLPASVVAPAYARSLVRMACEDWSLEELRQRAQSVANELVSNAVEHSRGESVLVLSHDRRGLTVAVRDSSPGDPRPADADDPDDDRFGLRVVESLSDGWGVTRHPHGKTVWALLRNG